MTVMGKAAEHAVLQKLASFTKIPKADFVKEAYHTRGTDEELPIYSYPILEEKFRTIVNPLFYSVSIGGQGTLNLIQLIEPSGSSALSGKPGNRGSDTYRIHGMSTGSS